MMVLISPQNMTKERQIWNNVREANNNAVSFGMVLSAMENFKTSEDYEVRRTIATCCYSGEMKKP